MHQAQVHELLYQALETERGGIHVYQTALQCTVNANLKKEWQEYLEQTETHATSCASPSPPSSSILTRRPGTAGGPPPRAGAGDRHGDGLSGRDPEAAQLVAAECVVRQKRKII